MDISIAGDSFFLNNHTEIFDVPFNALQDMYGVARNNLYLAGRQPLPTLFRRVQARRIKTSY